MSMLTIARAIPSLLVCDASVAVGQGPWDAHTVVNMAESLASLLTPLHIAAEGGHAKLVLQLLEVITHAIIMQCADMCAAFDADSASLSQFSMNSASLTSSAACKC
jgi:hypothetical protein